MAKREFVFTLMVLSIFLVSGCDIYNTLYVKQAADAEEVPEGDIKVEVAAEDQVVRVEGPQDEENLAKTVYASTTAQTYDPFKVGDNPLGPFEKGESLGFTLGEWLSASGAGTYTVDGDTAKLEASFENLVPDSVYTIWCSRITFPPEPEFVDEPCGAADGSENTFNSDEDGNADYSVELEPLELSTEETATIITIAYHSDGETYGESAGDFGFNSHVQIFYLMPPSEDEEIPSTYEFDMDFVNHIDADFPEQDVFLELEVMEEKEEVEEKELPEDAIVIIIDETELVNLVPEAQDPDGDELFFTFTSPLDENGEWSTTYGDAGEFTVTVIVSDGISTASKEVLIIINKKHEAPVFDSFSPTATAVELDETQTIDFEVTASDLNDDDLEFSWKLDGISVANENSYSYESTYEDSGSHTVKVTVSDDIFETEKIWAVSVNNVNRAPVLEEVDDIELQETATVVIELYATDPDGDDLTYEIDDDRFSQDENVFSWDTTYDDGGEHVVTVTVSDGVVETKQDVTVTVENVNRPPVILDIIQK